MTSPGTAVSKLRASLAETKKNSSRMLSKLNKFETRLALIEDHMRPIQVTTEKYMKAKTNIGKTLEEVGKTYEYFRVANESQDVVDRGISSSNHQEYFSSMTKLFEAKSFFENHREIKSSGSLLIGIKSILKSAVDSCCCEIERLLSLCKRKVELVEGKSLKYFDVPIEAVTDINSIIAHLESLGVQNHLDVYRKARVEFVEIELKNHEESLESQWKDLWKEAPYRKGTHPFQFLIKEVTEIMQNELHLWGNTLHSSSSLDCVPVFYAISQSLVSEMNDILKKSLSHDASLGNTQHRILCQTNSFLMKLDVLDIYHEHLSELRDLSRPDVRQESTVHSTLTSLRNDIVESSMESIKELLESASGSGETGSIHSTTTVRTLRGVVSGSNSVDTDTIGNNCDLHPLTGSIIHCCKELLLFLPVYKRLVEIMDEIGIPVPKNASSASNFILSLLENLILFLKKKADEFDDETRNLNINRVMDVRSHALYDMGEKIAQPSLLPAKKPLFILNNTFSLLGFLKESIREASIPSSNENMPSNSSNNKNKIQAALVKQLSSLAEALDVRLVQAENSFVDVLQSAVGMSPKSMEEFRAAHEKDKSGKGRVLKAKFMIFNTGVEALLSFQGVWRISASELRETVTNLLFDKILKEYSHFFSDFSNVKFSRKHMKDYVRHTPQDLERILKSFFGRA